MRFSVITPTYNRAHTLPLVYRSLCAQTFADFEWLVVDDGSDDETRELVSSWKPGFPIRYFWQPNRGKHTAMNLGVAHAAGDLVLFFDSDDQCVPTALERFDYHWRQLPNPSRFSNLSCLCRTPDGAIVGKPYPADCVDAYTFADQLRYRSGERWGINRTDVLRQFPWPEDERYAPEGLVWNRIARQYAARFINEALRIYVPAADGISATVLTRRLISPRTTKMYYRELAMSPAPALVRLRSALNYVRFSLMKREKSRSHPIVL